MKYCVLMAPVNLLAYFVLINIPVISLVAPTDAQQVNAVLQLQIVLPVWCVLLLTFIVQQVVVLRLYPIVIRQSPIVMMD